MRTAAEEAAQRANNTWLNKTLSSIRDNVTKVRPSNSNMSIHNDDVMTSLPADLSSSRHVHPVRRNSDNYHKG